MTAQLDKGQCKALHVPRLTVHPDAVSSHIPHHLSPLLPRLYFGTFLHLFKYSNSFFFPCFTGFVPYEHISELMLQTFTLQSPQAYCKKLTMATHLPKGLITLSILYRTRYVNELKCLPPFCFISLWLFY